MFEKEAEEYGIENCMIQKNGLCAFVDSERTSKIWKDGAEFGYNKAKEEANEIIEGLMRFCRCFAQHHTDDIRYKEAEQFLTGVSRCTD